MPVTETITVRARAMLTLFAVAAVAVVIAPPGAKTQPDAHPIVERFTGTYENRLPDGGEKVIDEAIHEGTKSMRRVRRKVARRRLHAVNPPVSSVTIEPNGQGVRVVYGGSRDNRTPDLGVWAESRSADGGKVDVKHDVVGLRLHESYRQEDGTAVNAFRLSEDGKALRLDITIQSGQLPGPIVYTLEFRRTR
jgi:hypothetical protein